MKQLQKLEKELTKVRKELAETVYLANKSETEATLLKLKINTIHELIDNCEIGEAVHSDDFSHAKTNINGQQYRVMVHGFEDDRNGFIFVGFLTRDDVPVFSTMTFPVDEMAVTAINETVELFILDLAN